MFDIHSTSAAAYCVAIDGDDFRFCDSNAACLALVGMTMRFHPGLTPHDVFSAAVADEVVARYRACVETRKAITYCSEIASPTGPRMWRTTLLPMLDQDGRVVTIVGICCPTAEAADGQKLSLNDKASLALGTIDGGFWVYEIASESFETSQPLAELLAGPGYATLGLAEYLSFVHSEDLSLACVGLQGQERSAVEYRVVTFDGRTLWLKSRRRLVRDDDGKSARVVGLVADITKQKLAFQALEVEACTDPLTSIKNRRAFDRLAAQALREARASGEPLGLMLIDLDDFKPINDRYGHRVGDEILRKVARRIARHVRKSDCLARIGGDEFAILLRGESATTRDTQAARLRAAFAAPCKVDAHKIFVTVSTGLAVLDPRKPQTLEGLFERADRDLYLMKQQRLLRTA